MLFLYLIIGLIFGFICRSIGKKREVGATAGFFWGFFLGIIGLVVVLSSRRKDEVAVRTTGASASDELQKYKSLLDSGAISQEEYDSKKAQLLQF